LPYFYTHQLKEAYQSKMEWITFLQNDFVKLFEMIKMGKKSSSFDPYLDSYKKHVATSKFIQNEPTPSTS